MSVRLVKSENNFAIVCLNSIEIYFSYETPIGFRSQGRLYVCENCWGPTTGKHLNAIDGGNKNGRMS
jgi:hypothetical protein